MQNWSVGSMKRVPCSGRFLLILLTLTAAAVFCAGCGNTFRPIANPITQPSGDPGSLRNAIVVSTACPSGSAGCTLPGATTHLDVSGDSEVSQHFAGANPIRALLSGGFVFTVNQA